MKVQDWIFSVRYAKTTPRVGSNSRHAVVGAARSSTVEAALHLAEVPEDIRMQIRSCAIVRDFVEGRLDPDRSGYYMSSHTETDPAAAWAVCIGSVHEVLDR